MYENYLYTPPTHTHTQNQSPLESNEILKTQFSQTINPHQPGEKWNNGYWPHQSSFCEKLAESPFKKTKSWLHGSSTDTGEMAMSGTRNIIDTF